MRQNASDRGYTRRWQNASREYLKGSPWCVYCTGMGLRVKATMVDHKVRHRGNWRLFWDRSNWQGLCSTHHNSSKQKEENRGVVIGCDADGRPLDPNHPWNKG